MKKFIFIFWILSGFLSVSAQANKDNLTELSDLQEAQKIGVEVVKLFKEKKFEEAFPLAQKVIAIRENAQGKNHIQVAQAYRNLAYIQVQREKNKEAQEAFKKAFEIYEKNQPLSVENEKTFAELLEIVAYNEALNGDFVGAEKKFNRAVELREKDNGKDASETANSLLKLAQIYQVKGDYEKAAPLLLQALDIKTKQSNKLDEQSKEIYDNTSCTLSKLNRKKEQNQLRERFYPSSDNSAAQGKNISGGVVNGKALELTKPIYPYEAREKHLSGAVNVQVTIDEIGKVIFACAISGAKELQRTSEIAAYQSKFKPTTLEGKPVKVTGVIVYNYVP